MIPRKPPETVRYERDPLWERSAPFHRLVTMLVQNPGAGLPGDLTDSQRIAVEAKAAATRWGLTPGDYRNAFERAANETRLRVAAPYSDAPTDDLIEAWLQPEGRELWRRIIEGQTPRRDAVPSLQFALGVMLVTGGMRSTPHIRPAHDQLLNNPKLMNLVSELARGCNGMFKCAPSPTGYAQVTRLLPRLAQGLAAEVQIMMGEIAVTYHSMGIPAGRYLAVDGSATPAWAQQRSGKINGKLDQGLEDRLRRRTPEAGFKVYGHDYISNGPGGATRVTKIDRRWRGYMLTYLLDIATNLVLALDLRDASDGNEARTLREVLLPKLFEHLPPQLAVSAIVADAGYDDDVTHEHLLTHYGIHLVAARSRDDLQKRGRLLTVNEHPTIKAISGAGVAICRAHGAELRYAGLHPVARPNSLKPGEKNPETFHSRFECSQGCGKPNLRTSKCWSTLPFHPRTPNGRPKQYATGRMLLNRRNQVESSHSSLQNYKQSLAGSARTRVLDKSVQEAFIGISFATRALLTLTAERNSPGGTV